MTEIEITEHNLDQATDYVHDLWFSLEEILSQVGPTRMIKLRKSQSDACPCTLLEVKNVLSVLVNDRERIDTYDVNFLRFEDNRLQIVTNIPLTLEFQVSELCLSLR
jgi:hypothetical protein